jgi:hypothetical protein
MWQSFPFLLFPSTSRSPSIGLLWGLWKCTTARQWEMVAKEWVSSHTLRCCGEFYSSLHMYPIGWDSNKLVQSNWDTPYEPLHLHRCWVGCRKKLLRSEKCFRITWSSTCYLRTIDIICLSFELSWYTIYHFVLFYPVFKQILATFLKRPIFTPHFLWCFLKRFL